MTEATDLPTPGKRIVRAPEAEAWIDGYRFLDQAREEARHRLERSAQEAQQAVLQAHAQGLAAGTAEAGRLLADTSAAVDRYLGGLEAELAELSLGLVRQVLDTLDAAPLIAQLCQRALRDLRDEHTLTLRVPGTVAERLGELLLPSPLTIKVQVDAGLGPRQAILCSPAAVVHLDVDEQLQALRHALGLGDPSSTDQATP